MNQNIDQNIDQNIERRYLTLKELLLHNAAPGNFLLSIYADYHVEKRPTFPGKVRRYFTGPIIYDYRMCEVNNNNIYNTNNPFTQINIPYSAMDSASGNIINSYFVLDIDIELLTQVYSKIDKKANPIISTYNYILQVEKGLNNMYVNYPNHPSLTETLFTFMNRQIKKEDRDDKSAIRDAKSFFKYLLFNVPLKNCKKSHFIYLNDFKYKNDEGIYVNYAFENIDTIPHGIVIPNNNNTIKKNNTQIPKAELIPEPPPETPPETIHVMYPIPVQYFNPHLERETNADDPDGTEITDRNTFDLDTSREQVQEPPLQQQPQQQQQVQQPQQPQQPQVQEPQIEELEQQLQEMRTQLEQEQLRRQQEQDLQNRQQQNEGTSGGRKRAKKRTIRKRAKKRTMKRRGKTKRTK
jgi:hypothetical protein